MSETILKLAARFPASTETQWRGLVNTALKGKPANSLTHYTYDGLARGPVFASRPEGSAAITRAPAAMLAERPWHICPLIEAPDIETANRDALTHLEGGASALLISAHTASLLNSPADMGRLLDHVRLDYAPIIFEPGALKLAQLGWIASLARSDQAALTYGFDPLRTELSDIAALFGHSKGQIITLDGRVPHEAGASEAQEIAYIGAALIETLRGLSRLGVTPQTAIKQIGVMASSDSDTHLSLIKLRALSSVWNNVLAGFGLHPHESPLPLHAVTSKRMMARIDPWSNLLRLTSASFACVCAGANTLTTLPFSQSLEPGMPDSFAQRVSRNIGLLLMEESHLGQVIDPAHGSYMHEQLTRNMGQTAWTLVQEIERRGGLPKSLRSGHFARLCTASANVRLRDIAKAKVQMAGVNAFAQIKGRPVQMRKGTRTGLAHTGLAQNALPAMRLAAPFEILHAASAKALPRVTLLTLSDDPMCAARVQFCQTYLASGGIETTVISKPSSRFALTQALNADPSDLLVMCASDADYDAVTADTLSAIQQANSCERGGRTLWACARPKRQKPWMQGLLYDGQDRVGTLFEALGLLGVHINDA